jgi:pimeloyl-ACP methyl ester carboxylesterase
MPHSTSEPATDRPPTVYVLHGLLGTAYGHFGQQITRWQKRLPVVPIDLPGHGRCPVDAEGDYLDGALDYLIAIVERFGAGRLVAASYLGGPLAVRAAVRRPDLVRSVVLTGFAPGLDRSVFLGLLAGFHRLVDEHPDLAAEYDRLHTARWRDTLAAFTADVERDFERLALVRSDTLAALPMATLILNGSLKSVERAAARDAARSGRSVFGQVIDGAGHIASHDAPLAFSTAVEEFWQREEH